MARGNFASADLARCASCDVLALSRPHYDRKATIFPPTLCYNRGVLSRFLQLITHDVGIDLGTANTLIFVRGRGIVVRAPSVVARAKKGKRVIAIGEEARRMIGKTPSTIETVKPLRGGVIADFDAAEAMLQYWIRKIHRGSAWLPKIPRPRVVVGIPSGITEVERRAVQDAALGAGAREAFLIEEPMASAIGAGIPVTDPSGYFIVDIGGGTTEVAVISLGGMVLNRSLKIAGEEMTNAIVTFARSKHGLVIGESTAEEMKLQIGSAIPIEEESKKNPLIHVSRGRHLETGLPKSIKFTSVEVREALSHVLNEIIVAISETIEQTPPELVSDIVKHGLTMTGGGSKLRGLTKLVADAIKMPVWLADHPEETVVRGCAIVLEKPDLLARVRVVGGLR